MTKLIPILLEHDITVKRLTEPVTLEVEAYEASAVETTQYFQAHYLKDVTAEVVTESVEFPAGSFFVPSGQPLSNFISYILEPETDDNLVTWGYLDNVLRETGDEGGQGGRGGRGPQTQRVPIYRLMHKADLAGELVQPFNQYERNRYIRD
jgi:hypothetical protein